MNKCFFTSFAVFCFFSEAFAIVNNSELDSLIQIALKNNKALKAEQIQVRKYSAGVGTAFDIEKARVYYGYDANNMAINDIPLRIIGAEQSFDFPNVYLARRKLNKASLSHQESSLRLAENMIVLNVSKLYQQVVFCQQKEGMYIYLDSLFNRMSHRKEKSTEDQDMDHLQRIMTEAECRKIYTTLNQVKEERQIAYTKLLSVLQVDTVCIMEKKLVKLRVADADLNMLYVDLNAKNTLVLMNTLRLERTNWLPGINLHVFSGTNQGLGYRMNGFEVGLNVPLFFTGNIAKSKMAKLELLSWQQTLLSEEVKMRNFVRQKNDELELHQEAISYYEKYGSDLSDEIIKTARRGFAKGRLDFFQYIQSGKNAIELEIDYLSNMLQYNLTYLDLHYFNYLEL